MDDKYSFLRSAIDKFDVRFSMQAVDGTRVPFEALTEHILAELVKALRAGLPIHPPMPVTVAGAFTGMQLLITDPVREGVRPKTRGMVMIYTDLDTPGVQAEQSMIGFALQSIAVAQFVTEANAHEAATKQATQGEIT